MIPPHEHEPPRTAAVIVAAGSSRRMGGAAPRSKLLIALGGETVLIRSLRAFEATPLVDEILVVAREEDLEAFRELAQSAGITKLSRVIAGGATRSESVRAGVAGVAAETQWVAVHDAARPLVTPELITRVLQTAATEGAALVAIPVVDTLKESSDGEHSERTIPRERVWIAQTPQVFPRADLLQLLTDAAAEPDSDAPTDESALWEEHRGPVAFVRGSASNAKITTPEDVALAEAWLTVSNQDTP
jgi:2-C-methyl-D-erythritol 4-phosphate cytidylyltransferase